jgi:hypothetical protein
LDLSAGERGKFGDEVILQRRQIFSVDFLQQKSISARRLPSSEMWVAIISLMSVRFALVRGAILLTRNQVKTIIIKMS